MYHIETLYGDNWEANVGEPNLFDSEADAQIGIASLRDLGGEWAEASYRVVEDTPSPQAR